MSQVSPEHPPAMPARPVTAQSAHSAHAVQQQQPLPASQSQIPPTHPTNQPIAATTTEPTLREKLNAGDAHWQWKIGMRVVLVIIGIIGIGCAAWALVKFGPGKNPYEYELEDAWGMPWTLITFCLSVVWSLACILVFFLRRPNAPVHPGAQVGVDLIIWLAFIPTALFAIVAVSSVASLGEHGRLDNNYYSSSSDGYYNYIESNNTWVWNASTSSSQLTYGGNTYGQRDCMSSSSSSSYRSSYGLTFDNCTQQDEYVNALWKGKSHRFNTELTATVCQFLGLFLHLTLFIWACVDTNRRNSRKVGKDAEKMAADIVSKMVQAGAIIPGPGAAHMRPMPGQMPPHMMQNGQIPPHMMQNGQIPPHMMQQGQIPPQMMQQYFPQQYQHQHYGHFAPQSPQAQQQPGSAVPPTVASSSKEKGAGPRFA